MDWLDEIYQDLHSANILSEPDDVDHVLFDKDRIDRLIAAVRVAQEALDTYKNEDDYTDFGESYILRDRGSTAREALVKLQSGDVGAE